jgi:hypothetical protein
LHPALWGRPKDIDFGENVALLRGSPRGVLNVCWRTFLDRKSEDETGSKCLKTFGERGGARTHDPVIKSHVLYRLSYALTSRI